MSEQSQLLTIENIRNPQAVISHKQAVETGMAFTLVSLLVGVFTNHTQAAMVAALAILLLTMIWPTVLKPLAVLWLGFSNALGGLMSIIILGAIYLIVIVPMGWLSQKLGADSMQKQSFDSTPGLHSSFFKHRHHTYTKNDLTKPY